MIGGIALLLRGSPVDLSATVHSIEIAKRTHGVVHAVLVGQERASDGKVPGKEVNKETRILPEQLIALAGWLGDMEKVSIHIHRLDSQKDEVLIQFLCEYKVFCLVFGVESRSLLRRKTVWVAKLRRLLANRDDCFCPRLWSVIIPPGDDREYADLINRCSLAAGSGSPMGILIEKLRNGLKRLNNKNV